MRLKHYLISLIFLSSLACGGVTPQTNSAKSPSSPSNSAPTASGPTALIHISDFFATGILSIVNNLAQVDTTAHIQNNILTPLPHTDASLRVFDDTLYIVNRLGRDNIQVVETANFTTLIDFSTGAGTNPHDILVLSPTKAYIALYQPEADATAEEILVVNPQTGEITDRIDLNSIIENDGDENVRAERLLLVGTELWVLIQDLNSAFEADTSGKIAVINTVTDSLIDTDVLQAGTQGITLEGRNPSTFEYDANSGKVFVCMSGVFTNFVVDVNDGFGGIEQVDPSNYQSAGIIIDDKALGDYPTDLTIATAGLAFTIVGAKQVAALNLSTGTVISTNIYQTPGSFLPDIHFDGEHSLLIAERGSINGDAAGLVILDINNNYAQQGPLDVGGPPNAVTTLD